MIEKICSLCHKSFFTWRDTGGKAMITFIMYMLRGPGFYKARYDCRIAFSSIDYRESQGKFVGMRVVRV